MIEYSPVFMTGDFFKKKNIIDIDHFLQGGFHMAVIDVELYSENTDYFVVFHNIETESQKNRIKDWVNTLRGVSNSFSEYMFVKDIDEGDEYESRESMAGKLSIIPDGRYAGLTIEDAYNMNGHYSLAEILLNVKKMKNATPEELDSIYRETVEYTIPLLKEKEIEFEDFLAAYKPFLKNYVPGEGKTLDDWLELPPAEQDVAYDEMVNKIVERMYGSIQQAA